MSTNPKQPRPDDAVLGDRSTRPLSAAVLGGMEGVKQRLASQDLQQRCLALSEALKYGEEGLELTIQALGDASEEVQLEAFWLLRHRTERKVKQVLKEYLPLVSEVGKDYQDLQDFLAAEKWQQADKETRFLLLDIASRQKLWLTKEDIKSLPSDDLHTIDRLWKAYSKGRFGFSVQKKIWADRGTNRENNIDKICDRLGWRQIDNSDESRRRFTIERCDNIPFDLSAPAGHLPSVWALGGGRKESRPYTSDTESVMGFYSIDCYKSEWTYSSFFGAELVQCFLDRI